MFETQSTSDHDMDRGGLVAPGGMGTNRRHGPLHLERQLLSAPPSQALFKSLRKPQGDREATASTAWSYRFKGMQHDTLAFKGFGKLPAFAPSHPAASFLAWDKHRLPPAISIAPRSPGVAACQPPAPSLGENRGGPNRGVVSQRLTLQKKTCGVFSR